MNSRPIITSTLLSLALGAAAGGVFGQAAKDAGKGAAAPAAEGPVATVNGQAIPRSRVELLVRQQSARGTPDSEQLRSAIREDIINREIIAQEAVKNGLARRGDVPVLLDLARQQVLVNAYMEDYVRANPISDADIQKEYDAARGQAGEREYKARHILVESEDEAKTIIAALKKGAKFDELAQKSSKDTGTRERGGDLNWNAPSVFDRAFSDAMVKLEKGKLSDAPVRTRFGFHVIQLDDVRPFKFPSLADLKPRIQQQLVQRKIDGLVRDLRGKAKVE